MKNIINASLALMLATFVFSQGVFSDYDIPEYEYRTFMLSGDDLFSTHSHGTYSETSMNFGADYMSKSQSPGYNLSYGLSFNYESESQSDSDNPDGDWDMSNWWMVAPFSVDKYFGDTKGMFGFADGWFSTIGGDWAEGADDTSDLLLTVGAGFGRVVSAKPVAQAYAIADALGIDASDDTILAIAEVIGAAASYGSIYKDDADQQYYNDLAEAAGSEGSAMQIYKVLNSPAYNISDRSTGWSVRAGLTNNYMQGEDEDDKGDFDIEADYAMPVGMDKQLTAGFDYGMDMNEYGGTTMGFDVAYTMDHSYNWASEASFEYASATSGDDDAVTTSAMFLSLSTTKAILNQLSVTGSFGYLMPDYVPDVDEDAEMDLNVEFTYWIF